MPTPRRKPLTIAAILFAALALLAALARTGITRFSRESPASSSSAATRLPRPPRSTSDDSSAHPRERTLTELSSLSSTDLAALFRRLIASEDSLPTLANILGLLADRCDLDLGFQLLADYRAAHPLPPYQPPGDDNRDPFAPHIAGSPPDQEPPTFLPSSDDPFAPPTLLQAFFSHYRLAAPRFLADLQRFPAPRDQYDALSGYAQSSSDTKNEAPVRARELLLTASLTPAQRNTLVTFIRLNLEADLDGFFNFERDDPPPDQIRAHLGQNLQDLATIAPLLTPAEQAQSRSILVQRATNSTPYYAWEISSPGAALFPHRTTELITRMMKTGPDQAIAALSTATAAQSEMVASAFQNQPDTGSLSPPATEDPPDPFAEDYLSGDLANTAAIALFQAALNRNDPADAAQWLSRITDPAAHAAAEKKLQK